MDPPGGVDPGPVGPSAEEAREVFGHRAETGSVGGREPRWTFAVVMEFDQPVSGAYGGVVNPVQGAVSDGPARRVVLYVAVIDQLNADDFEDGAVVSGDEFADVGEGEPLPQRAGEVGFDLGPVVRVGELEGGHLKWGPQN